MSIPEEWRGIPGYEGSYQASNLGRVRSLDRITWSGRQYKGILRRIQTRNRDGYQTITLSDDCGKLVTHKVHRLVALCFLKTFDITLQIDHKNGIRDDNRACNLRCVDISENNRNRTVAIGKSGQVGVFPNIESSVNPWRVYITRNYKKIYVGSFPTIESAVSARNEFIERAA